MESTTKENESPEPPTTNYNNPEPPQLPGPRVSSVLPSKASLKVGGIALLLVLVLGLGGTVYYLSKERTRALQDIGARITQLESRVQAIQNSQNRMSSQTNQSVEILKRDIQQFKGQVTEQFVLEGRAIQELKSTHLQVQPPANISPQVVQQAQPQIPQQVPVLSQATPPSTLEREQVTVQPEESTTPSVPELSKPPEPRHIEEPKSKEAQGYINFIETVARNFFAIAKEVFSKFWSLLFK